MTALLYPQKKTQNFLGPRSRALMKASVPTTTFLDLFVLKENAGNNNKNKSSNKVDDNRMNETWERGTLKVKGILSAAFLRAEYCPMDLNYPSLVWKVNTV